MSAWICCYSDGKAAAKIVPPRLRTPSWTGLGAESEEKREPASDIEAAVVDSLKVLDPERPIREADIAGPVAGRPRTRMTQLRHRQLRIFAAQTLHPISPVANPCCNGGEITY
jgi:hypothetical protein